MRKLTAKLCLLISLPASLYGCLTTDSVIPPLQLAAQQMADELLNGLNSDKLNETLLDRQKGSAWNQNQPSNNTSGKNSPPKRKIAIAPFWHNETPVSRELAKRLSDSVLSHLIKNKRTEDVYIAREDLKSIMQDLDFFNESQVSGEKRKELMNKAGADILISGLVKPLNEGQAVNVFYRATNVKSGVIHATTKTYRLEYDFEYARAIGISRAIEELVGHFSRQLGFAPRAKLGQWHSIPKSDNPSKQEVYSIRPQGIRHADSGIQTPFGGWISSRIIAELQMKAVSAGRVLKEAKVKTDSKKTKNRNVGITRSGAGIAVGDIAGGDFILSGKYWILGNKLDLHITLKDSSGRFQTRQVEIRTNSINQEFKPEKEYEEFRKNDDLGPISLKIRSNKGFNPVYKINQKLKLFVEASQDSYLYCFYQQADGSVLQIFPNRDDRNTFIKGGIKAQIPSDKQKSDWIVSPPTGVEFIKCFAFDRDIENELPNTVKTKSFGQIPDTSLSEISIKLRAISNFNRVGIAENSMTINVER